MMRTIKTYSKGAPFYNALIRQMDYFGLAKPLVRLRHWPGKTGMLSVFCAATIIQRPSRLSTTHVKIPVRGFPCLMCRTLSPVVDQRTRAIARSGRRNFTLAPLGLQSLTINNG